jgi:hypothetical protein
MAKVKEEVKTTEMQIQELQHEAQVVFGEAKDFNITTPDQFKACGELRIKINGKLAQFEGLEKEAKKPFQDKVKTLGILFKNPIDVLKEARAKVDSYILGWQERLEADRRAKEAELKRLQEAEAKKLEAKAAKAKDPEKKAELQAQAEATKLAVPIVATEAVKVEGMNMTDNWAFEVTEAAKVPIEYQMPDEVKIGKVVRATKGTLAIPGVRIYSYKSVRSSRG